MMPHISVVLLHPNCVAKSSTANEVDREKELLPYGATVGMSWYTGHSRVTNHYTLLLNYSQLHANFVTYAQLVRLRSDRTFGTLVSHGQSAKRQHLDYVENKVEDGVLKVVVFKKTSQGSA
jgi:hypothetical protein